MLCNGRELGHSQKQHIIFHAYAAGRNKLSRGRELKAFINFGDYFCEIKLHTELRVSAKLEKMLKSLKAT